MSTTHGRTRCRSRRTAHSRRVVRASKFGGRSRRTCYAYSRDTTENHLLDSNEQFGLRLRNKAIELQLGRGNWQALTDATLLAVTAFRITPTLEEIDLGALCNKPCAAGSTTCPPRQQVRRYAVQIGGQSLADASIARSLQAVVRVRHDAVVGACPA